jgi:hypothetical protein
MNLCWRWCNKLFNLRTAVKSLKDVPAIGVTREIKQRGLLSASHLRQLLLGVGFLGNCSLRCSNKLLPVAMLHLPPECPTTPSVESCLALLSHRACPVKRFGYPCGYIGDELFFNFSRCGKGLRGL